MPTKTDPIAQTLRRTLESPNQADPNGEPANVVDALFAIARGLHALAQAVRSLREPDGDGK